MFIAFKALGATCLAGALAASGVVTDHLVGSGDKDGAARATVPLEVAIPTTTTTEPPTTTTTTTTTEPPTTTTTEAAAVAAPVTLQPTVVPVAGAGSVVIVLQGPVIVVQKVKVVPGWIADVERSSGDINVVFRNGGRSFRFLASFKDRRLLSDIREIRSDGDHRIGFDWDRDGDGRH